MKFTIANYFNPDSKLSIANAFVVESASTVKNMYDKRASFGPAGMANPVPTPGVEQPAFQPKFSVEIQLDVYSSLSAFNDGADKVHSKTFKKDYPGTEKPTDAILQADITEEYTLVP